MTAHLSHLKAAIEERYPRLFQRLTWMRDRLAPYYAEAELRLVPDLCGAEEVALDVGANSGIYTFWMLRSAARVIAFEPNPALSAILRAKFAEEIVGGRLAVQGCAVSDADGEITLYIPHASALASVETGAVDQHGQEVAPVTVPRIRLDGIPDDPVGFIKIDVEGHEAAAVRGGLELIRRDRPNILVESEERHHHGALAELTALLEPLGYRGWYVQGGRLYPLADFDAAVLQSRSALNAEGTHRVKGRVYINNFLFLARGGVAERLSARLASKR